MIVRVIKTFRDRVTGSTLKPGLIIWVTEERAAELLSSLKGPFIEIYENEEKTDGPVEEEVEEVEEVEELEAEREEESEKIIEIDEGELILPDFNTMNKKDIVKFAKDILQLELGMNLTKAEMIDLINEAT